MYAQPFINWTQTEVDDPDSLRFQLDPNNHKVAHVLRVQGSGKKRPSASWLQQMSCATHFSHALNGSSQLPQ